MKRKKTSVEETKGEFCFVCQNGFEVGDLIYIDDNREFFFHSRCLDKPPAPLFLVSMNRDLDHCRDCGDKLKPNEIHAGIDTCVLCDPELWASSTEGT